MINNVTRVHTAKKRTESVGAYFYRNRGSLQDLVDWHVLVLQVLDICHGSVKSQSCGNHKVLHGQVDNTVDGCRNALDCEVIPKLVVSGDN